MSWAFTEEQIAVRIKEIAGAAVRDRRPLQPIQIFVGDGPPPEDGTGWSLLEADRSWGTQAEITAWLRARVTVPETWSGHRVVARVRPLDCEVLAHVDGRPTQAFDGQHHELVLVDEARAGQSFSLVMEAYSGISRPGLNPYFGTAAADRHHLAEAEAWCVDGATADLALDMRFAFETARTLDKNRRDRVAIIAALERVLHRLDFRRGTSDEAFYRSVAAARTTLREELFDATKASPYAPRFWAVGHAHIDTAWLWRLSHTRRKCARTFTTALEMMRRYPDYHFTCSQPQQYQYVKEDHPEIYEGIRQAVRDGRWETVGGMWVEADCNVVSGESMVRQFLYGLRFFQREFGTHTNVVWLPDVFGYSAAFPQIIRKAGMKYFMTIKIFWNQVNKPPYQTFRWIGLDGSEVLTHFSPNGNYNANPVPEQLHKTWDAYQQPHVSDSVLFIYGWGDGGGGPTAEMIENASRAGHFLAGPRVQMSTSEAFFEHLEQQAAGHPALPIWVGELYLEYHRGTYTSQGRNKRANRESEFLLQTAEQLSSLALLLTGAEYPQAELNRAWETVLTNQFHDIIPGSSITEVYEDSMEDYRRVRVIGEAAVAQALHSLAAKTAVPAGRATAGTAVQERPAVLVYNPLSWARMDVAAVPAEWGLKGQEVTDWDGQRQTLIELHGRVPSLGWAILDRSLFPSEATQSEIVAAFKKMSELSEASGMANVSMGIGTMSVSPECLENRFFRMQLDENGEITSLVDKRSGREVIDPTAECRGNSLLTFEDKPLYWDAWDIDVFYQDKCYPLRNLKSRKVIEEGFTRVGIELERTVEGGRGSTIRQRIYLYRDLPRIDFATEVDWKERQTLLKVAFPVTVHSARATYDIQFGNVERPTHWNTSWDWARFEVCGHKWADLSEGDYGVSILSDCKYGWDIRGNVMRLTLLKSAVSPDPHADEGVHRFTYSLLPHAGDWRQGQTVQRAYELNWPVRSALADGTPENVLSFAAVDVPNLIVETVKKAEDDDSLIVRLYECYNQRGSARLTLFCPVVSARSVNLLENDPDGTPPVVDGNTIAFDYRPYEIKTFKLHLAAGGRD